MSVSNNIITTYSIDDDIFHVSGSSIPINLEILNSDNLPLSGCVSVETFVVKTFPENILLNDCGCPVDECGEASLKITIKKITPPKPSCFVDGFILDENGLVLFTINGVDTQYIAAECCEALGFVSELDPKGISVCRWGAEPDVCDEYTEVARTDGYVLFTDGDGLNTFEVVSADCCPVNTVPEGQPNGMFKCFVPIIIDPVDCSLYEFAGIDADGNVFFNTPSGISYLVPSAECCPAPHTLGPLSQDGSGYTCLASCQEYEFYSIDISGYAVFNGTDGSLFSDVIFSECCPRDTVPELWLNEDETTSIRCKSSRGGSSTGSTETCRYLSTISAIPNPSGGLTSITISGKYCNGDNFSFRFVNGYGDVYYTQENVNACVIPSSITISAAPHRCGFTWDDSQSCNTQPQCYSYTCFSASVGGEFVDYIDCEGNMASIRHGNSSGNNQDSFCAREILSQSAGMSVSFLGPC